MTLIWYYTNDVNKFISTRHRKQICLVCKWTGNWVWGQLDTKVHEVFIKEERCPSNMVDEPLTLLLHSELVSSCHLLFVVEVNCNAILWEELISHTSAYLLLSVNISDEPSERVNTEMRNSSWQVQDVAENNYGGKNWLGQTIKAGTAGNASKTGKVTGE